MRAVDLKIIQQIYFPNNSAIILFDPNKKLIGVCPPLFKLVKNNNELARILYLNNTKSYILFNLSDDLIDESIDTIQFKNTIHFNKKNQDRSSVRNYFINNPDGTMRWIFPSTNRSAVFLSLYNNSGWKAKLYKSIMKVSCYIGAEKWVSQGYFTFENHAISQYDFLPNQYHDEYAIFTGTAGENRKAIVAVAGNKYVNTFIKIPLTHQAANLVQNESKQLDYIRNLSLVKMRIPKFKNSESSLQLSSVQPINPINQTNLSEQHLEGIEEYYHNSFHSNSIQSLQPWSAIQANLRLLNDEAEIKNDLSQQKVKTITNHLNQLVDYIGDQDNCAVGLAHGDFTPWNMYLSNDQIHVYDWEMSQTDMPLLFDVFHYVFQSQILIQQGDYNSIQNELDRIKNHPIIQNLISKYSIDWSLHYSFYLVYITSYYLPRYMAQQDLHMQAHWLVEVWEEALVECCKAVPQTTVVN